VTAETDAALAEALRSVFGREVRPPAWSGTGNLPWDDPDFSERMLRVHLDETRQAATRPEPQRKLIIDWLTRELGLGDRTYLLDLACGPGLYALELARREVPVTGIDFAPAAIGHAQRTAAVFRLEDRANFVRADIRLANLGVAAFDAVMMLYGQLTVFQPHETTSILERVRRALTPGGAFAFEILDPERINREPQSWWATPTSGIWNDGPCLDLAERHFDEASGAMVQRHHVIRLDTGQLEVVSVCDQVYRTEDVLLMAEKAGFADVEVHYGWDGLDLPDAEDWIVYVARVPSTA
jgi:SAM-dependent methyltransferase